MSQKQVKLRNLSLDCLKGFAILLVVYGHVIQYMSNDRFDFFVHPIFKFIYSFHMPLFMLISGYLFSFSINKRESKELIIDKVRRLIIPVVSWSLLISVVTILIKLLLGKETNVLNEILRDIKKIPYQLWFLWAVFYCSVVVIIVNKFFNDNKLIYLTGGIIMMLIPDVLNSHLYKFMYPYFIIGYFIKDYEVFIRCNYKKIKNISFALFPILLLLFEKKHYIYISRITILQPDFIQQLGINLFRWGIGLIGSIVIILILRRVISGREDFRVSKFLQKLGGYSMGIYIISGYMMLVLEKITIPVYSRWLYDGIVIPVVTGIILVVCIGMLDVMAKSFYIKKLLLGGK